MKIVKLKTADLEANIGQLPELPMNPRQWTKTDVDTLAKSLQETPELFEARPVLVVPNGDKYVILGGNMRFEASKALGLEEVPAIVFPATTPAETLKAVVIKDNGAFGAWDYDALANEWDDLPLADWGVPAWKKEDTNPDNFGEDFNLPDGDKSNFCTMSFQVSSEQRDEIEAALQKVKETEEYKTMITFGNENSNGNALALIIEQHGQM